MNNLRYHQRFQLLKIKKSDIFVNRSMALSTSFDMDSFSPTKKRI